MTAAQSRPYVPLEAFLEMEPEPGTRLEWSGGLIYSMSGGTPQHSRLAFRVQSTLARGLSKDCTMFDAQADIWVEVAQFYGRADGSIVSGALHTHTVTRNGKKLGEAITNPVVIIEVLSPSTESRDRGEKFEAYKQISSLHDYVLASQEERRIEVRRRVDRGWSVDIATAGHTIEIHGMAVSVDDLYG